MPKPSLPLVDELCDRLGYAGSEPSRRQVDLTNSTKAWRVAYVSDDGTPGEDIRHWNPEKGNEDLKRMAEKFLEEGYGLKHWPSTSEGGLGLEFPRDKET